MRIELIREGLLVKLAKHYTARGTLSAEVTLSVTMKTSDFGLGLGTVADFLNTGARALILAE